MKSDSLALGTLCDARERGVKWLLQHIGDDGSPVGAEEDNGYYSNKYYRLPWALLDAGERGSAAAVLSWIEEHALDDCGDLREGAARERHTYKFASYPLAIIGLAAWGLGRYDTGNAVMDLLEEEYQDRETGGALTLRPEVRASTRQDLFPTAQLGYSALMAGRQEVADRAYGWFVRLYQAQPALPHQLYTVWDEKGLVTKLAENDQFDFVTDFRAPRQAFYNPGIAAAFLGRYGAATRTAAPFELARAFLSLSEHGTAAQFDHAESRQICKYGWGASVMLECAPNGQEFLPAVHRMAEWFVACQERDGTWTNSPFLAPHPTDGDRLEVTAEMVLHLSTVITALRGAPRAYSGVLLGPGGLSRASAEPAGS